MFLFAGFAGYAWPCYSFLSFIPCTWVFPGDSLFPLAVGDIIITSCCTSCQGSTPLDESSNQRLSHLDTPLHMHFNIRRGIPKFILHPSFGEETSYAQSTLSTVVYIMFLTHTFKVSACSLGVQCQLYLYFNIPTPTWHMCTWLKSDFSFKDGGLDIWRCACCHPEPTFYSYLSAAECRWSLLGGYSLCKDPYYPADVHHVTHASGKVDRQWGL